MIATDDPELVFLPGERFILRVLTALPPEDLSRDAALKAGLIALAHRAIECFEMIVEGLVGNETLQEQVFEYILLTYPDADMDALRANLRAAGVDEMEGLMGTMAEALMEQGMERGLERGLERGKIEGLTEGLERGKIEGLTEGLERGKIEGLTEGLERGMERGLERGKAEVLMRLMERRFGPLSRTVRDRIAGAGPDELDAWSDRILDAGDLEAMFDVSSRH